ncbi:hypothetical protein A2U01_0010874 [Trifolium medium]|uniref:Uncharacterized protein n=1 Tax=Trifolium medium TaxID=97028 RepID=A0A392MTI6_9FABA|nr:hypothetical protein [Trifolium medium]
MEEAMEAPAERTVEATVQALVETVLRQEEMILKELEASCTPGRMDHIHNQHKCLSRKM